MPPPPPPNLAELPAPSSNRTGWPWTLSSPPPPVADPLPCITLVTPSYNQAAFIEETIRSVLLQGYPNLEYIVIDGGSTDGTVEILHQYSPWIDHWVSEPDDGQPHAIAKGLAHATGDWFNWLNSDDTLQPGALSALIGAARIAPAATILAGTTDNVREGKVFGRYGVTLTPTAPAVCFSLGVNQPGSLLRRDAVLAVGGIRKELHLSMDLDLWLRLIARGGPETVATVQTPIATYRYHAESKTCAATDAFALEEFVILHDLAIAAGSRLGNVLLPVRALSPLASLTFQTPSDWTAERVDHTLLDRLLVSDSLLFRACLRGSPKASTDTIAREFLRILDQLLPLVASLGFQDLAMIEARALVRAEQILGKLVPQLHLRALRRQPALQTLLEAGRLLFK